MGLHTAPLTSVIALGLLDADGDTSWIATGFLFEFRHPTREGVSTLMLGTAAHVADALGQGLAEGQDIIARCEAADHTHCFDLVLPSIGPDCETPFHTHPDWDPLQPDAGSDVAIMPMRADIFAKETGVAPIPPQCMLRAAELADRGLTEGDDCYLLGFPMGLVDPAMHLVTVRKGSFARVRGLTAGHSTKFMLDAFVFPGNSGGPVMVHLPDDAAGGGRLRAYLVGVVGAYAPYEDVAISQQTGRPRVVFSENSGLAIAYSVDVLLETVEDALSRYEHSDLSDCPAFEEY